MRKQDSWYSRASTIQFPGLKVAVSSEESKMINFNQKSKVIISLPACAKPAVSGII